MFAIYGLNCPPEIAPSEGDNIPPPDIGLKIGVEGGGMYRVCCAADSVCCAPDIPIWLAISDTWPG
jgi:hypothetical protein